MRQVILDGPRSTRLSEAPTPVPAPGELLIEVKATAICGTDVHIYSGDVPVAYPRVPGHEVAGVVQEVAAGVTSIVSGDPVAINPNLNCNSCERCIVGKENLCVNIQLMGRETDGVLRQYLTIPQTHAFKIPSHVSFAEGALMQPLSTVVHAQRLADIKPTESVAVLGQGASGLMHTRLSNLAGAYPVIAVGRSRWKLDLAEQMAADHVVSAAEEDPVPHVRRLAGGDGADVVIEAVGRPETIQQALDMAKPGGRVVVFGISPTALPSLDLFRMYLTEKTIIFPRATTRADYYRAVRVVDSRRLELKSLITQEYALEDSGAALQFAEEQQSKVLRVVIRP